MYVIFWPNHPEFEKYTADHIDDLRSAVYEEAEKTISDLGSEGCDPGQFLEAVETENPGIPDDEAWLEARDRALAFAAEALTDRAMAVFSVEPPEDDPVVRFRMPDGIVMALTYEEDF